MDGFKLKYIRTISMKSHAHAMLLHLLQSYRFSDLMNEDGITFEIGEDTLDNMEEEEFAYSPHVQFSNEEMLNMLNMNGFDIEEEDNGNENGTVTLCGMNFSKLKMKMENLTTDGKVNEILYYFLYIIFFLQR